MLRRQKGAIGLCLKRQNLGGGGFKDFIFTPTWALNK